MPDAEGISGFFFHLRENRMDTALTMMIKDIGARRMGREGMEYRSPGWNKNNLKDFLPFLISFYNDARSRGNASPEALSPLALLWFEIENYFLFRKLYGEEISNRILEVMERLLRRLTQECSGDSNLILVERLAPGQFFTVFDSAVHGLEVLPDLSMSLRLTARNRLNQEAVHLTGQNLEIRAGYAPLHIDKEITPEGALYNALHNAQHMALGNMNLKQLRLMEEFRSILEVPLLGIVYQPIVDLRSGDILGWEALARGPRQSHFHSPAALFDFAEEVGSVFDLEKVCREQAIRQLGSIIKGQKLFLNIHPRTLGDPSFSAGETRRVLKGYGLEPDNVVFEITERHSIRDFTLFHRTLEHYREQGYRVAIDDVGAGYSGLWNIAELRPDFIKVDMSLVRGIDSNPVKRALLETLIALADKIGCGIIPEGIETDAELSSLLSMGAHYGQGYYLARPDFPKPLPSADLISRNEQVLNNIQGEWKCSIPILELVEHTCEVGPKTLIADVKKKLEGAEPISAIVVLENQRPLGLVMSHHLDRQLGTQYGVALYYQRTIDCLMDSKPLIVEGSTPVEEVAKAATTRERFKIYDHIIVTRDGFLVGIVSVQKMLDALARVQVEVAKGANPLTGLPGNVSIEREIKRRSQIATPTSLIYVDLDHFKVYNDHYGFEQGDRMIMLISKILCWAVKRHGTSSDFVGHVGGDDFVAITHPDHADRICLGVVRCFKRLVLGYYSQEDRTCGYVSGKDRVGNQTRFSLVSVSLAIVDCRSDWDLHLISRTAAEMKRYAKSIPGNTFVRDRRISPGDNSENVCGSSTPIQPLHEQSILRRDLTSPS